MDNKKTESKISRGTARWHASRLKPQIKSKGITNIKKAPKNKKK